jgi:uncharacterized protein YjbI with pentapeptide repeats
MLAHLTEVDRRSPEPAAVDLADEIVRMTGATPNELLDIDLDHLHDRVGAVLGAASARLRSGPSYRGRDLAGQDLRELPLRDADLRGATLIAAALCDQDLGTADLLGTDLRDADVRGADLSEALFLSQSQVNAARGDSRTRVSDRFTRPSHWS